MDEQPKQKRWWKSLGEWIARAVVDHIVRVLLTVIFPLAVTTLVVMKSWFLGLPWATIIPLALDALLAGIAIPFVFLKVWNGWPKTTGTRVSMSASDPRGRFASESADLTVLFGTWNAFVNSAAYGARWTFSDDHLVVSTAGSRHGKWQIDGRDVRIEWDDGCFETLRMPLDEEGTPGDSWQGKAMVRAIKCRPATLKDANACVGRWRVAVNSGKPETFTIELESNWCAIRNPSKTSPPSTSKWRFKNGQVTIDWPDGWTDVLRPGELGIEKAAFHRGKLEDITFAVKEA